MIHSSTRFLITAVTFASLCSPLAFASDNETSSTSNVSKNPLTGTVKTEKIAKHKRTHGDGSVSEKKDAATAKYKTDGTVDTKKVEETSETPK